MKIQVRICTPDHASQVLERIQQVLQAIDAYNGEWPTTAEWQNTLPDWFSSSFSPPRSADEIERELSAWREMSAEDKARADVSTQWTLEGWLYWLQPEQREWQFVDGRIQSPQEIEATLEVEDWPTALGAFDWLARAAGATSTQEP